MVVLNGAHHKLAILRAYFYLQRRGTVSKARVAGTQADEISTHQSEQG